MPSRPIDRVDHHFAAARPAEERSDTHQKTGLTVGRDEERRPTRRYRGVLTTPMLDVGGVHAGLDQDTVMPPHRPGIGMRPWRFEVDKSAPFENVVALT